jgi:omega-amidase
MQDLKVTIIQSDIYWEGVDANLAMFEEKIWQIEGDQDLIVLPEMFTTGFTMNAEALAEPVNSKTFRWMKQQSAQTKAVIVGSYIVKVSGSFFNRLYAVFPDGSCSFYDKRHLFALAGENLKYTPGEKRMIFEVKGWKVMPLICYDLRFPVWSRSQKTSDSSYEYDLLLYVANWPKPRIQSWDILLSARAIENQSYVLGANRLGVDGVGAEYCGHSGVYDFFGRAICHSSAQELFSATLNKMELDTFRSKFPFSDQRDDFVLQ